MIDLTLVKLRHADVAWARISQSRPTQDGSRIYIPVIMAHNNLLLAAVAVRPESFDGKNPEKGRQWWNAFNRYADFSRIQGEHKARLLGMMLSGIALHWYEGLPEATQTDINLVTQAFREKYLDLGPHLVQQQIDALSNQQKDDESVEEYAAEARTRLDNLGFNANQQMTLIIKGFRRDIRAAVLQHLPFADVPALINKAKHVEQALKFNVQVNQQEKKEDVKSAIDELTANVTSMQQAVEMRSSHQHGWGSEQPCRLQRSRSQPNLKRCYICDSTHHLQKDCHKMCQYCELCGSELPYPIDCPKTQSPEFEDDFYD